MKYLFIIIIFLIAGCAGDDKKAQSENTVATTNIDAERLYKNNCASCHKLGKDFTGPNLKGSLKKWGGDKKAMYAFIRNPGKSILENAYAKKVFEKWKKIPMTAFPTLSDAELDAIMNHVETYSK